jgi:hypothetical protein
MSIINVSIKVASSSLTGQSSPEAEKRAKFIGGAAGGEGEGAGEGESNCGKGEKKDKCEK